MNVPRGGLLLGLVIGAILSIIFVSGFAAGAAFGGRSSDGLSATSDSDLKDFLTTYHLVTQRSYFHPLDKHRLVYAAINGMLQATGDPHTLFLSPNENRVANTEINGAAYGGIGAIVLPSCGTLDVVKPIHGAPAANAGLRVGDEITAIDGVKIRSLLIDDPTSRIHGRPGSKVRLTIQRAHARPFTVSVRRAEVAPITAYGRMLSHGIGQVVIMSFGDTTGQEVSQAISELRAAGARAIVLDLRDNPGGYVDAAQHVVSEFVAHGVVAYERDRNHHLQTLPVLDGQRRTTLPVAVLVNSGTASAAEITAGALHDLHRATVIGTTTYGKGSMQSVYALPDGSSVRITDRFWLTPAKHSIQKVGIKPDITVNDNRSASCPPLDAQLNSAEQYLERHLAG